MIQGPGAGYGVYSEVGALTFSFNGMFCTPDNELPSDIQPGATVSGSMIVDLPLEAVWLTYDPSFGLQDGAAWRVG